MKTYLAFALRVVGLILVFSTMDIMDILPKWTDATPNTTDAIANTVVTLALMVVIGLSKTMIICAAIFVLYFLPWMLASERHSRHELAIFWLTFFLGWTVIGWVIALVWACMDDGRPATTVQSEFTQMAG